MILHSGARARIFIVVERQRRHVGRHHSVHLWPILEVAALPFIPSISRFFRSNREVGGIGERAGSVRRAHTIEDGGREMDG